MTTGDRFPIPALPADDGEPSSDDAAWLPKPTQPLPLEQPVTQQPPPLPIALPPPLPPRLVGFPCPSPLIFTPAQPLDQHEAEQFLESQQPSELQVLASVATATVRLPFRRRQASLVVRAGALGLDVVFIAMVMLVVICVLAIFVNGLDWFDDRQILLILLALYPIYSLAEVFGPATVGKVIFGVHVTDSHGAPSARRARLRRWPVRNLPLFVAAVGLAIPAVWPGTGATLGGLPAASWKQLLLILAGTLVAVDLLLVLRPDRRTFHDHLSGTAVYHDVGGAVQFTPVEMTDQDMNFVSETADPADGEAFVADAEIDVPTDLQPSELSQVDADTWGTDVADEAAEAPPAVAAEDVRQDLAELAAARTYAQPRDIRPAPFGIRVIATVLDFALLIVLAGTIVPVLLFSVASFFSDAGPLLLFVPLTVLTTYVGCEIWAAASPGKFLTGLRITSANSQSSNVGQRFLRAGLKNIPIIVALCLVTILALLRLSTRIAMPANVAAALVEAANWAAVAGSCLYVMSCLMVLGPSRRSLHDRISGTAVYEDVELAAARVRGEAKPTPFEVRPPRIHE